jgi:hypothetical protein
MWSNITNTLTAVATLFGVLIAGFGLSTWRKQLKGTYDYELAKKTLFSVYKLRDALRYVRQPFLSVGEASRDNKDIPWEQSAYLNRWKEVREALILLETNSLECEVVWGKGIPDARKSINPLIGQLNHAMTIYIRSLTDNKWRNDFESSSSATLYEHDENDEYNVKLIKEIKKFEDLLKPHLGRKD